MPAVSQRGKLLHSDNTLARVVTSNDAVKQGETISLSVLDLRRR